jgi:hypothetical protein
MESSSPLLAAVLAATLANAEIPQTPFANSPTALASSASRIEKPRPTTGLGVAKLAPARLQPNTALDSLSTGLTSQEEWRRVFPKREQP